MSLIRGAACAALTIAAFAAERLRRGRARRPARRRPRPDRPCLAAVRAEASSAFPPASRDRSRQRPAGPDAAHGAGRPPRDRARTRRAARRDRLPAGADHRPAHARHAVVTARWAGCAPSHRLAVAGRAAHGWRRHLPRDRQRARPPQRQHPAQRAHLRRRRTLTVAGAARSPPVTPAPRSRRADARADRRRRRRLPGRAARTTSATRKTASARRAADTSTRARTSSPPKARPIVAPLAGTIVTTTYQAGGAGYYLVEHTRSASTSCSPTARPRSFAVAEGQAVAAGQQLCQRRADRRRDRAAPALRDVGRRLAGRRAATRSTRCPTWKPGNRAGARRAPDRAATVRARSARRGRR